VAISKQLQYTVAVLVLGDRQKWRPMYIQYTCKHIWCILSGCI